MAPRSDRAQAASTAPCARSPRALPARAPPVGSSCQHAVSCQHGTARISTHQHYLHDWIAMHDTRQSSLPLRVRDTIMAAAGMLHVVGSTPPLPPRRCRHHHHHTHTHTHTHARVRTCDFMHQTITYNASMHAAHRQCRLISLGQTWPSRTSMRHWERVKVELPQIPPEASAAQRQC